jgi:hypothetical protein
MTDFQTDPVQVHVPNGTAIWGESDNWVGVFGQADGDTPGCAGVYGNGLAGTTAVAGVSETGYGVFGATNGAGAGVWGKGGDNGGPGVIGSSVRWHGVYGETSAAGSTGAAAVWGENKADGSGVVGHSLNGAGIYGKSEHGNAAYFEGDVLVTGDVKLLNGDVAELFAADPSTIAEPGTLMSLDQTGQVAPSSTAYDRKVIGVVAGAGQYRPGMILDSGLASDAHPIAMIGKVYCLADAAYGPIEAGDLLTTSPTAGHAMKVSDHDKAAGAMIGKALGSLGGGSGLIPVVVSLQ